MFSQLVWAGWHNFPEKLPTVSEAETKVFVMEISSKQFQFVRSRCDDGSVEMGYHGPDDDDDGQNWRK